MLAVTQDILKQLDLWSTAWHFYISHDFNLTINIYYRYYRSFSYSHIEKAIHAFICFGDYICYLFSGLNMKKLSFLPPIQNEVRMSRITSPGFSTVFLCPVYFGIYFCFTLLMTFVTYLGLAPSYIGEMFAALELELGALLSVPNQDLNLKMILLHRQGTSALTQPTWGHKHIECNEIHYINKIALIKHFLKLFFTFEYLFFKIVNKG